VLLALNLVFAAIVTAVGLYVAARGALILTN
jgi:hypothetical protein